MSISVRISAATPEADLEAVVQPGVSTVLYPRCESPLQVERADRQIAQLERLRGIRPGSVTIGVMIESPGGVCVISEIAASSPRISSLGTGPHLDLAGDALAYAQAECELVARAFELPPLNLSNLGD